MDSFGVPGDADGDDEDEKQPSVNPNPESSKKKKRVAPKNQHPWGEEEGDEDEQRQLKKKRDEESSDVLYDFMNDDWDEEVKATPDLSNEAENEPLVEALENDDEDDEDDEVDEEVKPLEIDNKGNYTGGDPDSDSDSDSDDDDDDDDEEEGEDEKIEQRRQQMEQADAALKQMDNAAVLKYKQRPVTPAEERELELRAGSFLEALTYVVVGIIDLCRSLKKKDILQLKKNRYTPLKSTLKKVMETYENLHYKPRLILETRWNGIEGVDFNNVDKYIQFLIIPRLRNIRADNLRLHRDRDAGFSRQPGGERKYKQFLQTLASSNSSEDEHEDSDEESGESVGNSSGDESDLEIIDDGKSFPVKIVLEKYEMKSLLEVAAGKWVHETRRRIRRH